MSSADVGKSGAEQLWRALLSRLDEGVALLNPDGTVRFTNEACRRFFDVSTDRVGQNIQTALGEPTLGELAMTVVEHGGAQQQEITVHRLGRSRLLKVDANKIDGGSSDSAALLFVFHDITTQREFEEVRSDFVANVSHELRTPISILAGYIENLADFPRMPRPEQNEIFGIMQEHATRLKSLLDDLLTLACFESHSDVLDYTDLDLSEFLLRLKKDWQPALASKDMVFVAEVADNAATIHVDRFRFEQVMHNLVDNAFKYTPIEGQIRVRASVVDDRIEISVEDNGAGIPQEDLPHIFERFYRVDKARSRKYGGTGLGLSIVKHIITLHGGSVRAESTLQMSTRIIISLPRAEKAL